MALIFFHLFTVDLFAGQQRGVAAIGDFNLLQHLTNDRLDVLVVDLHALKTVDFLDFVDEIFCQWFDAQHFENVVRVRATRNQRIALLDEIAFLHVDHLGLGDQVLDWIALFRNDRDLALGLVFANEFDLAGNLGNDRIVFRNTGFEQFGNTRQTAGDVAGLGGFAAGTGENVACLNLLTVFDRQRGTRSQHIALGFGFTIIGLLAFAKQGQARTQVLLLLPAGGTIFRDHALGNTRRVVDAFFHGLAVR